MSKRLIVAALVVAVIGATGAVTGTALAGDHSGSTAGFVTRQGPDLKLNGRTFQFSGTNNYYLMYSSRLMVDDVFADAKAAGFTVLRTWGFLDIGNADGTNSISGGPKNGVYFQYWDGQRPAYNDGESGLARLDYVLYAARQAGIKLVIPLTNNWNDFGGMDQYVRWRGGSFHDDFYSDAVIRGWYRDWISHVLNRVNTLTGVAYKDDPTVMTWELGNEPRCLSAGAYPRSANCTTSTLVSWADEMTRHIKSIDRRHLASVGDEGFFCDDPTSSDWTVNCGEGVDTLAFTRLPAVDVLSYHLYPDGWGKDAAWGESWITRHARQARQLGKPSMLGEFGFRDKATRNPVYQRWTDALDAAGGNGWLYWILSGVQDDGSLYPDYDGFTVYCPSPVCTNLSNAGAELAGPQRTRAPVADHDSVLTEFNQPVTLAPAANDIAYRSKVKVSTIDLDATTAGQQQTLTLAAGTFSLAPSGSVTFTPVTGFVGKAVAHYTVRDLAGHLSNPADITVTVKPDPTAAVLIASWEDGVDGWAPGSWQVDPGTLTQTPTFHTEGAQGLHVASNGGNWFGVTFPSPVNLSGKTSLKYEIHTGAAGTSRAIALQVGPGFVWCQSDFVWVNQDTALATVEIDLAAGMSCEQGLTFSEQSGDIRGMFIFFNPGEFDIDNVRAE
jgi:mannan endo-1,4-beta-mannosidase